MFQDPHPPDDPVQSLLVRSGWALGLVVARARHLHEELPQLCDVIVQGRGRVLLALLDEIPQTDAIHELTNRNKAWLETTNPSRGLQTEPKRRF